MEEDDVTEILADLEGKNKAVAYDFLLKPFGYRHEVIEAVYTQKSYTQGATRPDLVIKLVNQCEYRIEVKINNTDLTHSEERPATRDLFIIPDNYCHKDKIPGKSKITTWGAFFNYCSQHGCNMLELNSLKSELGL